jgi:hypothetical protein
MGDKTNTQFSVRVDRNALRHVDEAARWLGMTRSEGVRAALALFASTATARYLESADALDEVGDPAELAAARDRVSGQLVELQKTFFTRRRPSWIEK